MVTRLRELWRYRDLLRMLVIRDLKNRYKGSFFGYLWTLLNPLLMCGIFYFVFTTFARFDRPHYALELLLGILLWNIIADSVNTSIYSIIGNASLIKKVYLPLEIFPLSVVAGVGVNFLCALPVLILFCLAQGVWPTLGWLWVLVAAAVCLLLAVAFSLIVSVLAVRFKDTNHFVPVLLQVGFFASPVLYPLSEAMARVPGWAAPGYLLNPYATWITVARNGLVVPNGELPGLWQVLASGEYWFGILCGLPLVLILLIVGWIFFANQRRRLAEYL
ncbi:MAG TPA: ABC transporter permease [bacterium]|nr:ABC transporter permease [bacterium]